MNWLIHLLGGYTHDDLIDVWKEIRRVHAELHKAKKNDMRDPITGRFVKRK